MNNAAYIKFKEMWNNLGEFDIFDTSEIAMDTLFKMIDKQIEINPDFQKDWLGDLHIEKMDTYLRIKSDEYAIAVVLFEMIGPLHLSSPEYKDVKDVIDKLLSMTPFFITHKVQGGFKRLPHKKRRTRIAKK
jgi:hypothetical protein